MKKIHGGCQFFFCGGGSKSMFRGAEEIFLFLMGVRKRSMQKQKMGGEGLKQMEGHY